MTSTDLHNAALRNKIKFVAVPISCLNDIKADIEKFKDAYELNNFQKWIVNAGYITEVKGVDFDAKSIVVAVGGYNLFRAVFNRDNKQVADTIGYPAVNLIGYMVDLFTDHGYHLDYVHWMPQKRLAVRSGLVEYGRNNISYDSDYGSFIELATFVSDIEPQNGMWRESQNSDNCTGCSLCLDNCPTGAISSDRFLINTDKCLAAINEGGTDDFADWIPKTAHHKLVGCLRCQDICPMNAAALRNITDKLEFDTAETDDLLSGKVSEKSKKLNVHYAWESVPRNLTAMFNNPELVRYIK